MIFHSFLYVYQAGYVEKHPPWWIIFRTGNRWNTHDLRQNSPTRQANPHHATVLYGEGFVLERGIILNLKRDFITHFETRHTLCHGFHGFYFSLRFSMVFMVSMISVWFPWFPWFPYFLCGFHGFCGFHDLFAVSMVSMVSMISLRFPWFPWFP